MQSRPVRVPAWSRNRVALLGDAAYAVSLLAGQGALARLPVADRLVAAALVGKPTADLADLAGRGAAPTPALGRTSSADPARTAPAPDTVATE